jgi:hypothetical protein
MDGRSGAGERRVIYRPLGRLGQHRGALPRSAAMLAAGLEFLCWTLLGLMLGLAGHWWKSHADPYPDILDKDSPALNIALTEHTVVNHALGHRYDDAGFWEYYSLRNLFYYVVCSVVGVLVLVYATAEGHAAARAGFCSVAGFFRLTPIFCP